MVIRLCIDPMCYNVFLPFNYYTVFQHVSKVYETTGLLRAILRIMDFKNLTLPVLGVFLLDYMVVCSWHHVPVWFAVQFPCHQNTKRIY